MPQIITISARTKEMKARKEEPVTKNVTFPVSFDEVKKGIGPWKTLREMFEDAVAHRKVIIQSKMRQALENGGDEADVDESGLAFEE